MPIFSGENEFILLSISESQIGNTSLSPIYNIKCRLDNHLNKKKKQSDALSLSYFTIVSLCITTEDYFNSSNQRSIDTLPVK